MAAETAKSSYLHQQIGSKKGGGKERTSTGEHIGNHMGLLKPQHVPTDTTPTKLPLLILPRHEPVGSIVFHITITT